MLCRKEPAFVRFILSDDSEEVFSAFAEFLAVFLFARFGRVRFRWRLTRKEKSVISKFFGSLVFDFGFLE